MELTKADKTCMIDVLRTLIYNNLNELKTKLTNAKDILSEEKYKLMILGDEDLFSDDSQVKNSEKYKAISVLDGRWCLQSQLFYHLTKTKKIKEEEYNELLKI
tara:strand:+ start:123 stop:431 length:309 start_codon:yes stop_codon:yes gene_type:complete